MTSRINERPIFVLGHQKSGTTAIARLLAEATGESCTSDIFCWLGRTETDLLLGECDWDDFLSRARFYFSRRIIKEPGLTFFSEQMTRRFPEASFVFVARDPYATIRSTLNRLGLPGDQDDLTPDQFDRIARAHPHWIPVITGLSGNCRGRTYIETLANRVARALEIGRAAPPSWITVRYEDFLADKQGVIADTARRLGLPVSRDIRPILDQPFQPPSRDDSAPEDFFGPDNVARITSICGASMRAFGYEPRS